MLLFEVRSVEVGGLLSEDRVQSLIAKAKGLNVEYMHPKLWTHQNFRASK